MMRIAKLNKNQKLLFGMNMTKGENLAKYIAEGIITPNIKNEIDTFEKFLNKLPLDNKSVLLEVEYDSALNIGNFLMKDSDSKVIPGFPPLIERSEGIFVESINDFLSKNIPMEWLRKRGYMFARRFEKIGK